MQGNLWSWFNAQVLMRSPCNCAAAPLVIVGETLTPCSHAHQVKVVKSWPAPVMHVLQQCDVTFSPGQASEPNWVGETPENQKQVTNGQTLGTAASPDSEVASTTCLGCYVVSATVPGILLSVHRVRRGQRRDCQNARLRDHPLGSSLEQCRSRPTAAQLSCDGITSRHVDVVHITELSNRQRSETKQSNG